MKNLFNILLLLAISNPHLKAQKSDTDIRKHFEAYLSKKKMTDYISKSLPDLEKSKKVFLTEADAQHYMKMIESLKSDLAKQKQDDEIYVDLKIEQCTTEDILAKKGNYPGGMQKLEGKLKEKVTFYKISLLREKGASSGMAYLYWVFLDGDWVYFAKPHSAFK